MPLVYNSAIHHPASLPAHKQQAKRFDLCTNAFTGETVIMSELTNFPGCYVPTVLLTDPQTQYAFQFNPDNYYMTESADIPGLYHRVPKTKNIRFL